MPRIADTAAMAPDALTLAVNAEVRVETDPAGRITRARRQDVFDLFQARGKLGPDAYQAVRRLQDDIAILHRVVSGGGDITPRVDRSVSPESFNGRRLSPPERGSTRLWSVPGPPARGCLWACASRRLSRAGAPTGARWSSGSPGERLPDAQGAIVRVACENLAGGRMRPRVPPRRRLLQQLDGRHRDDGERENNPADQHQALLDHRQQARAEALDQSRDPRRTARFASRRWRPRAATGVSGSGPR